MVREVHVGVPVVGGDVVLARADAIADGALDQRGNRGLGPARDGQTVGAEQTIDGIGTPGRQELPLGIGPEIFRCARDQDGSGSDQGNQLVLIEREHELTIAEGLEVATEPVRKRGVQARDGRTEDAPAQGRTGMLQSRSCKSCAFIPISLRRFPPLAKGGLGGVVPARPVTRSSHALSLSVLSHPSREARRIVFDVQGSRITPPDPPFARGGKGWVARAVVESRATKTRVSIPSLQYGQHQLFTGPPCNSILKR